MRLSDFIRASMEQILNEWETFARTLPATEGMNRAALRDHAKEILEFVIRDIETPQSQFSQSEKSQGRGPEEGGSKDSAAQIHANLRAVIGFDMIQLSSEYRALRASVIKLWAPQSTKTEVSDLWDLIRFNESIDQALMESTVRFQEKIKHSKDMFIGILGHDLRTPLSAILMSSEFLLEEKNLNAEQIALASQIETSAKRMNKMITDLLDLTRINLGAGLPITRTPMNMGAAGRKAVEELQAAHPDDVILLEATGNLEGLWDQERMSQVFSNLIGNAIQYGLKKSPIAVTLTGRSDALLISVHNKGKPIPQANLKTIFNSMTRVVKTGEEEQKNSENLGLGLYIVNEIVMAHGGKINVDSSEKAGTTFTVQLPRTIS